MAVTATLAIVKQEIDRASLEVREKFEKPLSVESVNLLRLGRESDNPRTKFLSRIFNSLKTTKLNMSPNDLSDEERALRAEAKLEQVSSEGQESNGKQERVINRVWSVLRTHEAAILATQDPFLHARYEFVAKLTASYQVGNLCFEYGALLEEYNKKIIALRESYFYPRTPKTQKVKKVEAIHALLTY